MYIPHMCALSCTLGIWFCTYGLELLEMTIPLTLGVFFSVSKLCS